MDDQNWRLQAKLDAEDRRSKLDRVLGRVRGPDIVKEVGEAVHTMLPSHTTATCSSPTRGAKRHYRPRAERSKPRFATTA